MENKVKFKEMPEYRSMQTIALFLKKYKYYFVSINEYENNLFYCMVKLPERSLNNQARRLFKKKEIYNDYPLTINVCSCCRETMEANFIFTQQNVLDIINDVPENYVGEPVI